MKKPDPKKAAATAKKTAETAKAKMKSLPGGKHAGDLFKKIGERAGATNKRVDEWQEKWMSLPKNRTKYESIKDAPAVVSEEMFAMFNDILDFVQREEGGQSHVFNKMKTEGGEFAKNPAAYMQKKGEEGKKKAVEAKKMAEKKASEAKKTAGKGMEAPSAGGLLEKAKSMLAGGVAKAKTGMSAAKDRAGKGMEEARKRADDAKKMAEKSAGKAAGAAKKMKKK